MIILASESSARIRLLRGAGIVFESRPHRVDEEAPVFHLPPEERSQALACAKALSISPQYPDALIIGSDQVLSLEGRTYEKPEKMITLKTQLVMLRGKAHRLYTSVACILGSEIKFTHTETAVMVMREFSNQFLDNYVKSAGPAILQCAGGYEIEGMGIQLFEEIHGDHHSIQGLPLIPLMHFLRKHGELAS